MLFNIIAGSIGYTVYSVYTRDDGGTYGLHCAVKTHFDVVYQNVNVLNRHATRTCLKKFRINLLQLFHSTFRKNIIFPSMTGVSNGYHCIKQCSERLLKEMSLHRGIPMIATELSPRLPNILPSLAEWVV